MSYSKKYIESDVVIIGSGPGGGSVARDLSRMGKNVVLCEAGPYVKKLGKLSSSTKILETGGGKGVTKEGMGLSVGKAVGGSSVVFAANAFKPPKSFKAKTGIDLETELNEVWNDFHIEPLPDSHFSPGLNRITESARSMGLDWKPVDKWIQADKCPPNCGKCFLGCPTGAKTTATNYVDEAIEKGADLLTRVKIDKVLSEGGRAIGVLGKGPKGRIEIRAEYVIVSGGGIGTAGILQRSGITDAGSIFFVDPISSIYGITTEAGNAKDVPMSTGVYLEEEGILLTDIAVPFPVFLLQLKGAGQKGISFIRKAMKHKKVLGISAKVKDDLVGRINPDGSVSKPITAESQTRINKGIILAENILMNAGIDFEDIVACQPLGGHLGGSAAIGSIVDKDCQTEIKNCYCLDASVLPEPWGIPMSATIIALGKRLARHIDDK